MCGLSRAFAPARRPSIGKPIFPSLWQRSQPAIDQYIELYHKSVVNSVEQVNAYLRQSNYGYRDIRFQVLIELLAAPNQVQVRSYGPEFTLVVTPSAELRSFDIRHAYLVYLLDPLATRHRGDPAAQGRLCATRLSAPARCPTLPGRIFWC